MPNRYVANGCNNISSVNGIIVFHFPCDSALRNKWTRQVKRTRDKWKGPNTNSVVCSYHFSKDAFEDPLYGTSFGLKVKRRQKKDAVTTIFKRKQNEDLPQAKRPAYE
ncbi:PREDICTED: THAP domain-containing protein 10-like [Amphimedon queenslandica]|uniref:THAP-type domain-containing protein n=1 Tax=Amphimedon queenslandica TaxID=400682 RepID=A0A1X7UTJ4_AMPQE|nr:PREDICTED: THAP domain-containing protein 10-like [Amphimedon queenslandica]|eukprot:XP_011404070.1 PREDICTED: THAP domain-containing protein 10-like [Amphimedon queenslandica]